MLLALAVGSPKFAKWALPCANLARDAVKMLAGKPAPTGVKVGITQGLFGLLLGAAGQARLRWSACIIPLCLTLAWP